MRTKTKLQAFTGVAALAVVGLAQAATTYDEAETTGGNGTLATAEPVSGSPRSGLTINGYIGNGGLGDIDVYSFLVNGDDKISISIDGANDPEPIALTAALYGPVANDKFDEAEVINDGLGGTFDIPDSNAPSKGGTFYVAVAHIDCNLGVGGVGSGDGCSPYSIKAGNYTITVKTAPDAPAGPQTVSIEVKPGTHARTPANPQGNYKIPVAIISEPGFDAPSVDTKTLTFGATGDENSLHKCDPFGKDVNGDNRIDLVCYFDNRKAGWTGRESSGVLKGKDQEGNTFEGAGTLKTIPLR